MRIPENAAVILKGLSEAGYEAYVVGGCVRDSLLGREPKDWDITTSARPEQIKAVFAHTIDTGIEHGTVTVMVGKEGYEVTTYRIDGEYEDSRHPKEVRFTSQLLEDLKRRDFTINAMAYNPDKGIVDAFDGIGDLTRKIALCVQFVFLHSLVLKLMDRQKQRLQRRHSSLRISAPSVYRWNW